MASSSHLPNSLKLAQLKQIAGKCGLATTGTKATLLSRLHNETTTTPLAPSKPTRILSIDMGIRNLAYCILQLPPPKQPKVRAETQLPILQVWHRLAVSKAPDLNIEATDDKPIAKEAFDPATLSTAAYTLLRERLLIYNPTFILIERQRFRSMGSKHILEWTIRVNMFESILYAIIHTLKAEGLWNGAVVAVAPSKVGPYWISEDDGVPEKEKKVKVRRGQNAKAKNKGAKIDLVRSWLDSGNVVSLGNDEVQRIAKSYIDKWDRGPGGRKGGTRKLADGEEKIGKLDDLADCLLQGVAWIQWEENKRIAKKEGLQALLSP